MPNILKSGLEFLDPQAVEVAVGVNFALRHVREPHLGRLLRRQDHLVFAVAADLRYPHDVVLFRHRVLNRADPDHQLTVRNFDAGNMLFDSRVGRVRAEFLHRLAAAGDMIKAAEDVLDDRAADRAFCIAEIIFHIKTS